MASLTIRANAAGTVPDDDDRSRVTSLELLLSSDANIVTGRAATFPGILLPCGTCCGCPVVVVVVVGGVESPAAVSPELLPLIDDRRCRRRLEGTGDPPGLDETFLASITLDMRLEDVGLPVMAAELTELDLLRTWLDSAGGL